MGRVKSRMKRFAAVVLSLAVMVPVGVFGTSQTAKADRNRWHFSGSLLVSKENIPHSEPPLLQPVQHLVQVAALGGVQTAHLVVGGCHVRHHHGDKAAGGTGAHI